MGKKTKDFFDGRLVYEAEPNEVFELEVDKDQFESFRCVEGGKCSSCSFQFLTMDVCLNFLCRGSERSDAKNVHFRWEERSDA
jgi:hypothetical protein